MNSPSKTYIARLAPATIDFSAGRSEKVAEATRQYRDVRNDLQAWIRQQQLDNHVRILPSANRFNVLFIEADEDGSQELKSAPHLLDFVPNDDVNLHVAS